MPDLTQLWQSILETYRNFGFEIPLTDEKGSRMTDNQMVSEFQWIYGQYRKFIGKKKIPWLSLANDLSSLLTEIKEDLKKDSKTPANRAEVIYQAMRNQWLQDTWNHVAWIFENKQEEERMNDGE